MVSYVFVWSVMYSPAQSCIVFYGLISGLLKFGLVQFFYCQLWSFMILYSYVSCMIRYDPIWTYQTLHYMYICAYLGYLHCVRFALIPDNNNVLLY